MKFFFETYGCQMNMAESAALKQELEALFWLEAGSAQEAGLIIINSCSVRATAEQRVFGRLAHYKALKKKLFAETGKAPFVFVTGCMAERLGEKLIEHGADYVSGASEKQKIALILKEVSDNLDAQNPLQKQLNYDNFFSKDGFFNSHYEEGNPRAYLPIMRGCNNFCSYCIVPYVRGREVSRPPCDIKKEIEFLASKQVREIILLGQNVNSYIYPSGAAKDKTDFPALLNKIAAWTEGTTIKRARFISSHPKDFSERTIEALRGSPLFCRHLHLCVQHGSNRVLAAMNRGYTRESYLELVRRLKDALPGLTLSTDILTGFPGETEEEFEEILTLMDEVKFLYSFMYHYNVREGTAAAALPGRIDEAVKRERLAKIIALQKTHTKQLLQNRLGSFEEVLVEGISKKNPLEILCRTERDEMVVCAGAGALAGSFINLKLLELRGNTLFGTAVEH
ncbi:MAG: tRNA (N6-isopentenyl adenosine(37)-C2)-methylthiotransferase MiaB [Spirochaetaceae bacterium]|nr:tRNA (N6-isopentenyl adenosine(37)-C2)-methylthiotransferase MiaB [Spirochaetaceae bacterium]